MAGPRGYRLAAVRTVTVVYELYARPALSVSARLAAGLTVVHRVAVYIVGGTYGRSVAGVPPGVRGVKARTGMGAAEGTAFYLKVLDKA